MTTLDIQHAIRLQVQKAASKANFSEVITTISRPMWELYVGRPWQPGDNLRICGTQTVVIDSDRYWSASRRRKA